MERQLARLAVDRPYLCQLALDIGRQATQGCVELWYAIWNLNKSETVSGPLNQIPVKPQKYIDDQYNRQ